MHPHRFSARRSSVQGSSSRRAWRFPNLRRLRLEPLEDRRVLSVLLVDADAAPGGDGLSWGTAYDDLQSALDRAAAINADADPANDVEQIWIAEGTYKPRAELEPGDARSASFSLVDRVTLYGGFAGVETTLDQRDVSNRITTLSGDLGQPDDKTDNAYTVVYCGADIEAGIDGVVITGGNANGLYYSSHPERTSGGGIYSTGTLTVAGSTVASNSASGGGGIYSSGTLTINNSTLAGNSASSGGGIYSSRTVTVIGSILSCNSANSYGGGIYSSGTFTINNSTLAGNSASRGGGAYSSGTTSSASLKNTIVAENAAPAGPDVYNDSGTLTGSHNLIGNGSGQSTLVDGVNGNLVGTAASPIDPMLSDWTQFDNGLWGYYLLPGSPALDAGSNALAVDGAGQPLVEDIYGNPRIQNGTVDMGAVEGATSGSPARVYMVTSLDNTIAEDDVLTFVEAFEAAQRNRAVGDAPAGSFSQQDVIQFAEGLSGTIVVDEGELVIVGDLSIEGPEAELLTFDAKGQNRVFRIVTGVSACLSGMTITGGSANRGGGIHNSGTLTVARSTLSNNSADYYGGGIYSSGTLTVTGSTLANNAPTGSTNCSGGAIYSSGALTVTNSTLSGNSASDYGGGICASGTSSTASFNNTIVAANAASTGPDVYCISGTLAGSHNLIGDGSGQSALVDGANGNVVGTSASPIDPRLSDWTQFDNGMWGYYLLPGSPALDAGSNALAIDATGQPLIEDIYGNPRIQSGTVDMGAVEGATSGSPGRVYMVTSLEDTIADDGVTTFVEAFEAAQRNQPVGDAPAGSFSQQDVIQFAEGLSGTILVDEGELVIVGDLRIEGSGAELLTFDAKGQNRVFRIVTGVSACLSGMTITGGSAGYGGAIHNSGTLTVARSTLSNNSADYYGGAIHNFGTLTVAGSTITGNSTSYGGGGIYSYSYGTLTVTDSALSGNSAINGGGIYSYGTLTVIGSTLSNNSAKGSTNAYGGGIHSSGTLTVIGSTLSTNSAKASTNGYGGGIHSSGTLTVIGSTLANNSATGSASGHRGGGIHSSGTATVTGSALSGNSAVSGGGIYSSGTLMISGSTLSGNLASSSSGGGILSSGTLIVTSSTLSGNSATSGGGIYIFGSSSTTSLNNTIVAGNAAPTGPDIYRWGTLAGSHNLIGNGSGQTALVHGVDGNLVGSAASPIDPMLSDWTQLDNGMWGYYLLPGSPALDAGSNALAVDTAGQPLVEDIYGNPRIQNDTVDIGAVEGATAGSPAQVYLVTSLENVIAADDVLTFVEAFEAAQRNQPVGDAPAGSFSQQDVIRFAEGLGGTILVDGGELVIVGNLSVEGPGAVLLTFDAKGQNRVFRILAGVSAGLSGMTITGGSAGYGGGIHNSDTLTVTNCTLVTNSAGLGGGIYSSGTLTVTGSTLSDNSSDYGGGIYSSGTLTVTSSILCENSGGFYGGGGIYNSGILAITDSTLSGNSTQFFGGGIKSDGTLSVTNCTLVGNSAPAESGGGIASDGTLTIAESTFTGNSARFGGAIHGRGTLIVTGSTFSGNSAAGFTYGYGGAIKNFGTLTVTFCIFSCNSASHRGGGIDNSGTMAVTDSTLSDNSAGSGGGIYNVGKGTVANSTLASNSSTGASDGHGGAIHNSGTLTVIDSTLSSNSAFYYGGGIYNSRTVTVIGSTLSGNSAFYYGGGIYSSGALTINNSTLACNLANSYGGGIYSSGTLTINNSTLAGNSASRGGGVYSSGTTSSASLNNTIVAENAGPAGPDVYNDSSTLTGSHNLIGNGSGQSAVVHGVDGNLVGTAASPIDPMLSDWTQLDNGLWGFYLLPGSPALDAGSNALAVDEAGQSLVEDIYGNPRIQNDTVDIGAVEGATAGSPARLYLVTSLENTIADDGVLTFLEAFEAAQRNRAVGDAPAGSFSQQDTIRFAGGLGGTILVDQGELVIVGDLRIEGPGAELLTFDAKGQNRVFRILASVSARLSGMTITGGSADYGGGIHNSGTLIVTNCTLGTNSASYGGGIYSSNTLTLTGSTLAGNSASVGVGGGILGNGTLTLTGSTLTGNSASRGGGVCTYGDSSSATLNNTIVAANAAPIGPDVYRYSGTLGGSHNLIGNGSGQTAFVHGVDGNLVGTAASPIDPRLGSAGRLLPGSPAINAGNNALAVDALGNPLTVDRDGKQRIIYGTVDMGADEFRLAADADYNGTVDEADARILASNWGRSGMTRADGDFNGDGVVNAIDAAILAAHFGTHSIPQGPGDANDDGTVDEADARILASNWGRSGMTWADGDFNGDGVINAIDAAILAASFGATLATGETMASERSTPAEPTVADATCFVGPLPVGPMASARPWIEPVGRTAQQRADALRSPGMLVAVMSESAVAAAAADDAAAAVDNALVEDYGSRSLEPAAFDHHRLAWSHTLARRNAAGPTGGRPTMNRLAVDAILAVDRP